MRISYSRHITLHGVDSSGLRISTVMVCMAYDAWLGVQSFKTDDGMNGCREGSSLVRSISMLSFYEYYLAVALCSRFLRFMCGCRTLSYDRFSRYQAVRFFELRTIEHPLSFFLASYAGSTIIALHRAM